MEEKFSVFELSLNKKQTELIYVLIIESFYHKTVVGHVWKGWQMQPWLV